MNFYFIQKAIVLSRSLDDLDVFSIVIHFVVQKFNLKKSEGEIKQ